MKTGRRGPEIIEMLTVTAVIIKQKELVRLIIAPFFVFPLPSNIQCETGDGAFRSGEHVMYELYFNQKFIWEKVDLVSLITNSIAHHPGPAYRVNLPVISSKEAGFSFKVRNTLTSVMMEKLEPCYFGKGVEEGKCYTVDETRFSFHNRMCYVNQKWVRKDGSVTETGQNDTRCIYDVLNILTQARSFDLRDYTVGQRIQFSMTTEHRVEEQTLIYRGIKKITAENDTIYRCSIFSLVEYDREGKEKEAITFYVTDDRDRLPIRLGICLNSGSAKVFLRSVSGYHHPQTSIITK